jgi:two-component system sensor histidine kinase UhpB
VLSTTSRLALRKNGDEFPAEISLSPMGIQEGPVVLAVVRDISERKHAEAALLESREQLRRLSAHLQTAREDERTMVAREIHDELGQSLTALKIDLASIDEMLKGTPQASDTTALAGRLSSMSHLIDTTA